jgi:hypothetical protein
MSARLALFIFHAERPTESRGPLGESLLSKNAASGRSAVGACGSAAYPHMPTTESFGGGAGGACRRDRRMAAPPRDLVRGIRPPFEAS